MATGALHHPIRAAPFPAQRSPAPLEQPTRKACAESRTLRLKRGRHPSHLRVEHCAVDLAGVEAIEDAVPVTVPALATHRQLARPPRFYIRASFREDPR